jgi:hypothetical protein
MITHDTTVCDDHGGAQRTGARALCSIIASVTSNVFISMSTRQSAARSDSRTSLRDVSASAFAFGSADCHTQTHTDTDTDTRRHTECNRR